MTRGVKRLEHVPCAHPGCDRQMKARGFCVAHYWRSNNGKPMDAPVRVRRAKGEVDRGCLVERCERPHFSGGYCRSHHARLYAGKSVSTPLRLRRVYRNDESCSVDGCVEPPRLGGYCALHYHRARAGRELSLLKRPTPQRGRLRWINRSGYAVVVVPGGTPGATTHSRYKTHMLEHRYVMQKWLGRSLLKTEQVHHRNGIRDENQIENLELKTSAHGSGISATDDVLHCIERIEGLVRLDIHQKAVLAEIKSMAECGGIFELRPIPTTRKTSNSK